MPFVLFIAGLGYVGINATSMQISAQKSSTPLEGKPLYIGSGLRTPQTTHPRRGPSFGAARNQEPLLQHLFFNTSSSTPLLQHLFFNTSSSTPLLQHLFFNQEHPTRQCKAYTSPHGVKHSQQIFALVAKMNHSTNGNDSPPSRRWSSVGEAFGSILAHFDGEMACHNASHIRIILAESISKNSKLTGQVPIEAGPT
jgi:hypothetical protein